MNVPIESSAMRLKTNPSGSVRLAPPRMERRPAAIFQPVGSIPDGLIKGDAGLLESYVDLIAMRFAFLEVMVGRVPRVTEACCPSAAGSENGCDPKADIAGLSPASSAIRAADCPPGAVGGELGDAEVEQILDEVARNVTERLRTIPVDSGVQN